MITATEKQVKIVAGLYEARDTMRRLLGEKYPERVAEFKKYIRGGMAKWGIGYMEATLRIAKGLQAEDPHGSGMQQGMIYAACVEILEEK